MNSIERNLNLFENLQTDYIPLRDFDVQEPVALDESLQKPKQSQTIKYYIDEETGKMNVVGTRYIRLGKVQLHNSLLDEPLFEQKFIIILDTYTQILHCFDIEKLYNEYIVAEKDHAFTKHGTFRLTDSTRSMILGEIFKTHLS